MKQRTLWSDIKFAFRFFWEFLRATFLFRHTQRCVTLYGSSLLKENSPYYALTYNLALKLSQAHFTILTGAGPGLMEAANKGASKGHGESLGCSIILPNEQKENAYLTRIVLCQYFFIRKIMLVKHSVAFIAMPGGFGTLDELFELITLIQTKKIKKKPIILMGREYWTPLMYFIEHRLLEYKTIKQDDMELFIITDSIQTAFDHINRALTND